MVMMKSTNKAFSQRFSQGKENSRLSFSDKRHSQQYCFDLSVHSSVHIDTPGPRYPLDPSILRHAELSLSALLAAGIVVP